jgi:hypothetical protein
MALHIAIVKVKSRPLHRHHYPHPLQLCCRSCHLPLCCLLSSFTHPHHNRATILSFIALLPLLPINILPLPSPSPIDAASVHGNCHRDPVAIPPPIEPPPLLPIAIVLPLLLSPFVTPTITHCRHQCPSPSCRRPAVHGTVAAVAHCNCAAIVQPCITS